MVVLLTNCGREPACSHNAGFIFTLHHKDSERTTITVHCPAKPKYATYMERDLKQAFGARVAHLRNQQNISLRGFALMVGLNKSYLVDIEHGRRSPTLDTIDKIARGLGMTISDLLKDL